MSALPVLGKALDNQTPQPDDERLWSVTTLIGVLDKPALVAWAANETAKVAVARIDVVRQMIKDDGPEAAIDYLKGARFKRPPGRTRTSAELGTAVHEACEQYAITGTRPDVDAEVRPFLYRFDEFLQRYQPEFIAAEVTVYSPTYHYAGTADAFVRIGGVPLILDYKTSWESYDTRGRPKKPYPEVGLQLAAYRFAEFAAVWRARRHDEYSRRYYLLSAAERDLGVPVPHVEGGVAVMLTPDRAAVHTVQCGPTIFETFLYVREAARYQFNLANGVVGAELIPPRPAPADDSDPFAGLPTE